MPPLPGTWAAAYCHLYCSTSRTVAYMRRAFFMIAGLVAFSTVTKSADAADITPELQEASPIAVRTTNHWAGYYFGIYGGGAWGRSSHDFPPSTGDFKISGAL